MSGSSAKETRRELRRSMGEAATNAVSEMQQNISRLANSVTLAHDKIFAQEQRIIELEKQLRPSITEKPFTLRDMLRVYLDVKEKSKLRVTVAP